MYPLFTGSDKSYARQLLKVDDMKVLVRIPDNAYLTMFSNFLSRTKCAKSSICYCLQVMINRTKQPSKLMMKSLVKTTKSYTPSEICPIFRSPHSSRYDRFVEEPQN